MEILHFQKRLERYVIPTDISNDRLKKLEEVLRAYLDREYDTMGRKVDSYFKKKRKAKGKMDTGIDSRLSKEIISDSDLSDLDEPAKKVEEEKKEKRDDAPLFDEESEKEEEQVEESIQEPVEMQLDEPREDEVDTSSQPRKMKRMKIIDSDDDE